MFDQNKLTWINGQYLRDLPADQLLSLVSREWTQSGMPLVYQMLAQHVTAAHGTLQPLSDPASCGCCQLSQTSVPDRCPSGCLSEPCRGSRAHKTFTL